MERNVVHDRPQYSTVLMSLAANSDSAGRQSLLSEVLSGGAGSRSAGYTTSSYEMLSLGGGSEGFHSPVPTSIQMEDVGRLSYDPQRDMMNFVRNRPVSGVRPASASGGTVSPSSSGTINNNRITRALLCCARYFVPSLLST